ncbi:membrane protein [Arthrobacter phage Ottawa]|nr:membrane protein [Arthrobacter phage Kharcho]WIC89241.1 membrane protein [Arthrobacter phage Ottawa]
MSYGEAVVLTALAFYAAGWMLLIFLLSKLYEWRFPAPFWEFIEKVWWAIVLVVDRALTGLFRAIARAVRA